MSNLFSRNNKVWNNQVSSIRNSILILPRNYNRIYIYETSESNEPFVREKRTDLNINTVYWRPRPRE